MHFMAHFLNSFTRNDADNVKERQNARGFSPNF